MKVAELISQNIFVRTNDNIGYDVVLKGDISFTFSAYDDILRVVDDNRKLDSIDIPKDAKDHPYIKSYVDQGVDASVTIMRHYEGCN